MANLQHEVWHTRLRELSRQRRALERESSEAFDRQAAFEILSSAIQLVAEIVGPVPIAHAARLPSDANRSASLTSLQDRLKLIEPLFRTGIPQIDNHESSILSAIYEVHAIRMGDEPRLFAKLTRKRDHRLRIAQWRAIILDAMSAGIGLKAAERQKFIAAAYGEEWNTIQAWKKRQPVEATPWEAEIDLPSDLVYAREMGKTLPISQWHKLVEEAGKLYRAEKRASRASR